MVFLHWERLSYGIISGGTIFLDICSLIMKFVCVWGGGEIYNRGEALPYDIVSPPPWGSSAMGFLPEEGLPYGIPSGGTFAIWYNFRFFY